MAHDDMRELLGVLEQRGLLRRVGVEVDAAWEIGCMAKWMFQALPEDERFGLQFDKVTGSDMKVVTGVLGSSTAAYATALGVEPDEINDKWVEALCNPVAPREVETALCQEVVMEGADADLGILPVPVWTPGKDAGPYITTIVVTRHAETGIQNYGVYRTLVQGKDRMVCNFSPGRQGTACINSHLERGEPAPVAYVIGAEPAVHLATVTNFPLGYDEMTAAGGLKGAPVDMVKARTVDLMVPARAEIIVEGFVHPGEVALEGPFGEFAGYMGPITDRPVVRLSAITHRKDPIFYGLVSQMPPSESTTIQSLTNAGQLLKLLRHDLGETGVRDVHVDLTFGGLLAHVIVAFKPGPPGDAKRIGRLIADISLFKRVTVVDHDVDVRDRQHLDWAMNSHYDPARDTIVIDNVFSPMGMDPSVRIIDEVAQPGSKVVIDATRSIDAGAFSVPSRDIMERARETWRRADLPEFDIPKRLDFRLDGA
jgi:4-hydroxy-3-polyprenylbenzoate decarboxylase